MRPSGLHLLDRRSFLANLAGGVGGMALASLLGRDATADRPAPNPLAPKPPHFPPRATRVLHIFCSGAVSHLDTWDYKPELIARHGQPMPSTRRSSRSRARTGTWRKARGNSGRGADRAR